MSGVTPRRLNAANRKHGLTSDVDHVAAQREGQNRRRGKPQLSRPDENNLIVDASLEEFPVNASEPQLERQRDMVRKHQRCRSRSAFATVDGNKVNSAPGCVHQSGEVFPNL